MIMAVGYLVRRCGELFVAISVTNVFLQGKLMEVKIGTYIFNFFAGKVEQDSPSPFPLLHIYIPP